MYWAEGDRAELRWTRPGYTGSTTGTVIKVGRRLLHVQMDRPGNGARVRADYPTAFKKIEGE